jgi:protein OS-9
MKHSIFALPALLRPALLLAAAGHSTFSVQDDLLAFPQYEVKFADEYILDDQARSRLESNAEPGKPRPSQVEQYRPSATEGESSPGPDETDKSSYEYMYLEGQPYLCKVPHIAKPTTSAAANDTLSKADEEKELARATERGWELLSGMEGSCVYFISGWWSYKFCYNDGVRQFHQLPPSRGLPVYPPVEDPGVDAYVLGMYTQPTDQAQKSSGSKEVGSATKKQPQPLDGELVQQGGARYLVHHLTGGTKCDLTGRPRRISVQFHCNTSPPSDRISLIKETSTCAYLMVIQTPRLCNDVAFLPPKKDAPNSLSCRPILSEDQVDDWKRDVAAIRLAERESQIWAEDPEAAKVFLGNADEYQLVGDTIVGGHLLVPPGMTLEKSAIVGGGKETYIDTVASSDGRLLGKEEIEKLGLGDPKSVEKLRQKLEEIAQGQDWKLDVVDTPKGREYRGIIGDSKDDEDEKKKRQSGNEKAQEKDDAKEQEGSKEEYYHEEL